MIEAETSAVAPLVNSDVTVIDPPGSIKGISPFKGIVLSPPGGSTTDTSNLPLITVD